MEGTGLLELKVGDFTLKSMSYKKMESGISSTTRFESLVGLKRISVNDANGEAKVIRVWAKALGGTDGVEVAMNEKKALADKYTPFLKTILGTTERPLNNANMEKLFDLACKIPEGKLGYTRIGDQNVWLWKDAKGNLNAMIRHPDFNKDRATLNWSKGSENQNGGITGVYGRDLGGKELEWQWDKQGNISVRE